MYDRLSDSQQRALRHGLALGGVIVAAWMYIVVGYPNFEKPGGDALVYWGVNLADPYAGSTVGGANAYLYSPAFAQAFAVLGSLPRGVFVVAWSAFLALVAWWLARPWPASLLVLALPVSAEIFIGNIHLLLAAAIVLGFRWPGTWAFVLLTKITPGIGLVWFAARGEVRALVIALGTTVLIAGGSFILAPTLWTDWVAVLRHDGGTQASGLLLRIGAAALIAVWGGRTDRRWTVPLAAMIALPVIWLDSFSMLLGCVAVSGSAELRAASRPQPVPTAIDATA
jgi:hypothetical protein